MADKSVSDVLAEVVTSAAEHAVKNAKFDVSAYGVVTEKDGQHYKIAVFGGEYGIVTNHEYVVGQKVVVTALQSNFRNLIVAESNTSVEILTVKSLVTGVDKLNSEFLSMKDKTQQTEDTVQDQLKNTINTWYRSGIPTTWTYPASEWKTDEEKKKHINDVYYDKLTGICYRWVYNQEKNKYFWMEIVDAGVINALAMATAAKDLATEKIRIFTETPIAPYDANDLWLYGGLGGELYICTISKGEGEKYSFNDWTVATKYTDDTVANGAVKRVDALEKKEQADIDALKKSMTEFNDSFTAFTLKDYKLTKEQVSKNKTAIESNAKKIKENTLNINQNATNINNINNTLAMLTVNNFLVALNLTVNNSGELCYISKQ